VGEIKKKGLLLDPCLGSRLDRQIVCGLLLSEKMAEADTSEPILDPG
jgi:hypothetical protein